jgi:hypothetical protein
MNDHIQQAADVMLERAALTVFQSGAPLSQERGWRIVDALADAGLLVTPEQRAVLDACLHHTAWDLAVAIDALRATTTPKYRGVVSTSMSGQNLTESQDDPDADRAATPESGDATPVFRAGQQAWADHLRAATPKDDITAPIDGWKRYAATPKTIDISIHHDSDTVMVLCIECGPITRYVNIPKPLILMYPEMTKAIVESVTDEIRRVLA